MLTGTRQDNPRVSCHVHTEPSAGRTPFLDVCTQFVGVVEVSKAGFGTTTGSWFDRSRPSRLPHGQAGSPSVEESHFSRNCPRIFCPFSNKEGSRTIIRMVMVAAILLPSTLARSDEGGEGGISALGLLTPWPPLDLIKLLGLDLENPRAKNLVGPVLHQSL